MELLEGFSLAERIPHMSKKVENKAECLSFYNSWSTQEPFKDNPELWGIKA